MTPATLLRYVGSDGTSAVTLGTIAERAGCSRREVERAVNEARLAGHPLITSEKGVYVTDDASVALRASQALRERALTQLVTARALRATGRRMQAARYRQGTLFEEAA